MTDTAACEVCDAPAPYDPEVILCPGCLAFWHGAQKAAGETCAYCDDTAEFRGKPADWILPDGPALCAACLPTADRHSTPNNT